MSYFMETMDNLLHQTAFFNLTVGNFIMILVACVFLYLAIAKGFEPLLLVPIAFGMLLVNIYPDIFAEPEMMSNGVGGLFHYFYTLDEWSILPSLIFLGVGAMTDFGPLIANPISFLLGAAAQFGIFGAYFLAILLGFNDKAAAAVSIIGGADGPTSIFLAGKLGQSGLMGPIAVAAYSYMALVPIIQPPIMKLFTTKKERAIKMENLRPVSKLERILFPIVVTIVVCLILFPVTGGRHPAHVSASGSRQSIVPEAVMRLRSCADRRQMRKEPDRTRKRQPSENRAGRNEDAWDWTKRGVSTKVEANCSLPEMDNPQHLPMLRVGIWWERRDSNSGPTD